MEESNKQEATVHYEERPKEFLFNKKLIIKTVIIVSSVTAALILILSLVLTSFDSLNPAEVINEPKYRWG